jgi:hypothetical protein
LEKFKVSIDYEPMAGSSWAVCEVKNPRFDGFLDNLIHERSLKVDEDGTAQTGGPDKRCRKTLLEVPNSTDDSEATFQ